MSKLFYRTQVSQVRFVAFVFEVEYRNLGNLSFYTDVEYLRNGLVKIFEQFKDDSKKGRNYIVIEAVASKNGEYIDLFITQIGSVANNFCF